jgi:Secretory lipase
VLLQQSKGDEILTYNQAVELDHRWCARGGKIDFKTILVPEHLLSGIASDPGSVKWLAQRFDGVRFTGNCGAGGGSTL